MVYAGFWRRFAAVVIDGVILVIPSWAFDKIIPYAGGIIFGFIYYPLFMTSPLQATPGKAIMGIAVLDENGQTLSMKAAIIRYLSTFLSALLLCIGYLMNLFTVKRQTLHDMIASSVVIKKTAPDVNYFQVWFAELKKVGGDATASDNILKTTTDSNAAKAIEDLHKLFQSGAITQAEYDLKKSELLKKI
jgi:uncharacterized RDD family membrane protein YckC